VRTCVCLCKSGAWSPRSGRFQRRAAVAKFGKRAWFRSMWGKPLGGSSPLSRIRRSPCIARQRSLRLCDSATRTAWGCPSGHPASGIAVEHRPRLVRGKAAMALAPRSSRWLTLGCVRTMQATGAPLPRARTALRPPCLGCTSGTAASLATRAASIGFGSSWTGSTRNRQRLREVDARNGARKQGALAAHRLQSLLGFPPTPRAGPVCFRNMGQVSSTCGGSSSPDGS
jgi:hypothetical protein